MNNQNIILKTLFITILVLFTANIFANENKIEDFSNALKYGWKTSDVRMEHRQLHLDKTKLLQIYDLNKQNPYVNVLKSALPGFGHFAARRYNRGTIIFSIEVTLFGTGYYFYDQAMNHYKNYEEAEYIGEINQHYLDARTPYMYSQGFFVLGMLVWVYTAFDAIKVTKEYNIDLWNSITEDSGIQNISITPTGIEVRF
jgi:hypothetical protein